MKVAEAKGWPAGAHAGGARRLEVNALATGLAHPRWLYVLPNGDVLVAETNAPPRPKDEEGVKAKVMKQMRGKAGAGEPSANRITLLRDADGDGVAEFRSVLLGNLNSPFGMALVGSNLYVANTDGIVKFRYDTGATSIAAPALPLTDLPGGERNHHWTKNIIASPRRQKALRHRRFQQQCRRARHGRGGGPRRHLGSRRQHAARSDCLPPGCAIPMAWPGSRPPACCGPWPTNATNSATTWCLTTSPP